MNKSNNANEVLENEQPELPLEDDNGDNLGPEDWAESENAMSVAAGSMLDGAEIDAMLNGDGDPEGNGEPNVPNEGEEQQESGEKPSDENLKEKEGETHSEQEDKQQSAEETSQPVSEPKQETSAQPVESKTPAAEPVEPQKPAPVDSESVKGLMELAGTVAILNDRMTRIETLLAGLGEQADQIENGQKASLQAVHDTNKILTDAQKNFEAAMQDGTSKAVENLKETTDEFSKQFKEEMRECTQKSTEALNNVRKDTAATIDKVHERAVAHIHELEQAVARRSKMYFTMNLPERMLNFGKYLAILVILSMAIAFAIERFL